MRRRDLAANALQRSAAAEDWMTWPMVAALRDAGMDLGGHSVNHPVLARLDEAVQGAEIDGCRRLLQDRLGFPMRLFSYPVGPMHSFDERTRACLAASGVKLALSLYGGHGGRNGWDPLDILRASIAHDLGPAPFRALATLPHLFARW